MSAETITSKGEVIHSLALFESISLCPLKSQLFRRGPAHDHFSTISKENTHLLFFEVPYRRQIYRPAM